MTEKDYNPNQKERKSIEKQTAVKTTEPKAENKEPEMKKQEADKRQTSSLSIKDKQKPLDSSAKSQKDSEQSSGLAPETKKVSGTKEEKAGQKDKPEQKKKEVQKKAPKKTEVVVNCAALPISTKYATAICKFIKNKKIPQAISDLNQVVLMKKAVPMKGEIPHRKGKIMSGRYPIRAAKYFIKSLKGLLGNANNHELNEPVIVKAIANIAERPFGKFGSVRRKRTHLKIVAKEKKILNKTKKQNGRKKNS